MRRDSEFYAALLAKLGRAGWDVMPANYALTSLIVRRGDRTAKVSMAEVMKAPVETAARVAGELTGAAA